jgi:hypothetical protein
VKKPKPKTTARLVKAAAAATPVAPPPAPPVAAPNAQAQAHRDAMARRSREQSAAVADIGDIPAVADPARREACRLDLERFLVTYFPASTGLSPFGDDHKKVIGRIQRCALEGGNFLQAVYRGFAKTTIAENSALWAVLYGHRSFVPIFGADAKAAEGNVDSIKLELAENDLLYADFPEVCHAIRALENKPQRCASQTYHGELTHVEWRADTIVLPTVAGSAASGAVLTARGIEAGCRGMKHKTPAGVQRRPDFVIVDDPQTDGSAASAVQTAKRVDVLRKGILRLGGHNRRIAVVINATVIQPGDLVEQMLDRGKFPAWQTERVKMVRKFGPAHETLWLKDYAQLRNTFDPEKLGDQQRAHRAATAFYKNNRAKMDAGVEVSWAHCFDRDTELSAIQHAYNILIDDGAEVFASECQNEPLKPQEAAELAMPADQIAAKVNGLPRGALPADASHLVVFVDVMKNALYWMAAAVGDDFTGAIVDYNTFPEQKGRKYFACSEIRQTLAKATGGKSLEEVLYAGLDTLVGNLMARRWERADGAVLVPERIVIDANWGESTDVVKLFCRQSPHAAVLMPSHGKYIGATSRPLNDCKRQPGDRVGLNWRIPGSKGTRYLLVDTNAWKSFMFSRLRVGMGGRGCWSIFGTEAEDHRLLIDHLLAEDPFEVEAKGRRVVSSRSSPAGRTTTGWTAWWASAWRRACRARRCGKLARAAGPGGPAGSSSASCRRRRPSDEARDRPVRPGRRLRDQRAGPGGGRRRPRSRARVRERRAVVDPERGHRADPRRGDRGMPGGAGVRRKEEAVMANEIRVQAVLRATKGFLSVAKDQSVNLDLAGAAFANAVQNVGTAYEQVVVPAEIATAGYAFFRNLDATNYVEVGVEVSAAFYPLLKLKPGEVALCRLSTTTFFARAHTAAVNLEMCLLAD